MREKKACTGWVATVVNSVRMLGSNMHCVRMKWHNVGHNVTGGGSIEIASDGDSQTLSCAVMCITMCTGRGPAGGMLVFLAR